MTMKRKMRVLAGIFVAGLLVLVALMKLGIVDFYTLDPAPYTVDGLYTFRNALGQMVGPEDFAIEEVLLKDSTNDLHALLATLFEKRGFLRASHAITNYDGWGRPYHVEWRANLIGVDTPMIHANDNELLIWSAGSNGINEYGGGDDLFDDCDWQIYKHVYKQWLKEKEECLHEDE
jgi:hypothetical protein